MCCCLSAAFPSCLPHPRPFDDHPISGGGPRARPRCKALGLARLKAALDAAFELQKKPVRMGGKQKKRGTFCEE